MCLKCQKKDQTNLEEPYPEYGDTFIHFCRQCEEDTDHTLVLTKKLASQLRVQEAEKELKESIINYCKTYGFTCRFLYESVIITTPISSWQYQYHSSKKTLRHESTVKINFETGDYAKTHEKFRNRKMTNEEIIDYIAAHDKWRQKHMK